MTKKIIALALAAVLSLAVLASCGEKTPVETGAASTDATVASEVPATNVGTIKLGGIGPLTGAAATYGTAVMKGAQLAVDEINAAGGVNGITFEFNFQDDEHDPEKAVNAYNTLIDDGMQILIGTVTSAPCIAVAAETLNDNIFMITPSASAVDCIANSNAFRICFSDPDQGIGAAQYIKDNNLATKVAVIYNTSDVYSTGIYEKFAATANESGLEIATAQAFTKDSATDFSVQLQKIKDSGADLIFLPIYYQEAALIIEQASNIGLDVKYFGCDGLDGLIGQLGDKANLAEGVMLLTPFAADAKDEKTVAFTAAYTAKYDGEIPNQFAADAYDAVYTVAKAMQEANVTQPKLDTSSLCDALVPVMTKISLDGVTGTMTWNEAGEPSKTPKAMVIKNGAYSAM